MFSTPAPFSQTREILSVGTLSKHVPFSRPCQLVGFSPFWPPFLVAAKGDLTLYLPQNELPFLLSCFFGVRFVFHAPGKTDLNSLLGSDFSSQEICGSAILTR